MPLGPSDPTRSVGARDLLPAARSAASAAGVTRLAEITRLDRLGLPVWQAVRPMSRALSVHQGKGATDDDARLGALLEAIESEAAETFDCAGPLCRFGALPQSARAPQLDDFALDRNLPPDPEEEVRWVEATDLASGEALFLPFDLVSLDLTRAVPSRFARSSAGIASGATEEEARTAALHEVVERDALAHWHRTTDSLARMESQVELDSIPFGWFACWRDRLGAAAIAITIHHLPTVSGSPLFACALNDFEKHGEAYRFNRGFGCHSSPEFALFRAFAEALQARATYIAGARDDLFPDNYVKLAAGARWFGFAPPLPPGETGVDFGEVAQGPAGSAAIVAALAAAGYPQSATIELFDRPGLAAVRAFVCGLGGGRRRRRAPA